MHARCGRPSWLPGCLVAAHIVVPERLADCEGVCVMLAHVCDGCSSAMIAARMLAACRLAACLHMLCVRMYACTLAVAHGCVCA